MSNGDSTTKEQMIYAGLRLFGEGRAPILRSLTAGTVAKEAGFHRQTFYRHWETQCDYVDDLLALVFAVPSDRPAPGRWVGGGRGRASFEESVRDQARRDFEEIEDDPTAPVRVGLLVMGQILDRRASAAADEFYEAAHRQLAARYGELLAAWDRRPRAPHTIDDIARAVRAQLVGNMLQVLVSGDATASRRLYISTALTLVSDMTEVVVDVDADGHAAAADDVPAVSR